MHKLALFTFVLLCGCFRGLGDVQPEAASAPIAQLEVHDASGAVWDGSECPRSPRFRLQFAGEPARNAAQHLFLLRGAPSDELLTDLRSAKLQAATDARLVPMQLTDGGSSSKSVEAQPSEPLIADARYTLLWVEPSAALTFPLMVSSSPAAGATLHQSLPAALDNNVPPNLRRVLLRFDGYVVGDVARAIQLRDARDQIVASSVTREPCSALGLGRGDCVQIVPTASLTAKSRYRVVLLGELNDATGAPIAARELAFDTAAQRDERSPAWLALDCAKDEARIGALCVLASDERVVVRGRADENGLLELAQPPVLTAALSTAGDYVLEASLAEANSHALLVLSDAAGNRAELPLELTPANDLPTVSIDEVRCDPLGPEPAQEYVELLNYGSQPVSLLGFTLTTDPYREGQRISSDIVVAAGERVLLVAPDFDVQERTDGEPPAAARIVRLPGALSLKNDGAALYLRDTRGRRVSAAPALAPNKAGQCIVRTSADKRSGRVDAFSADVGSPCTPGTGHELSP